MNTSNEGQETNDSLYVECPFCAEKIHVRAKKCRYCGEIVDPVLSKVRELEKREEKREERGIEKREIKTTVVVDKYQWTQAKSRTVYVILGIFLGELGIHNFYAGYNGRGIAQLLLTVLIGWLIIPLLIVGIWVIIEVCTVTKDVDGVKFD